MTWRIVRVGGWVGDMSIWSSIWIWIERMSTDLVEFCVCSSGEEAVELGREDRLVSLQIVGK